MANLYSSLPEQNFQSIHFASAATTFSILVRALVDFFQLGSKLIRGRKKTTFKGGAEYMYDSKDPPTASQNIVGKSCPACKGERFMKQKLPCI